MIIHISPDETILWQHGFVKLNSTIATTWALMFALTAGARFVTRRLSTDSDVPRWQTLLETVVSHIRSEIENIGLAEPERFLPFIGTLFLFIGAANLCTMLPLYDPPTGSLSTTAALALCVFVAVPVFGIMRGGLREHLKTYLEPTFLMLPFNLISELTRTLALALRLFGNIMSGAMIGAILLGVAPLFFPILMTGLGLLTGLVQAYLFSVLATVYIAAAMRARSPNQNL